MYIQKKCKYTRSAMVQGSIVHANVCENCQIMKFARGIEYDFPLQVGLVSTYTKYSVDLSCAKVPI